MRATTPTLASIAERSRIRARLLGACVLLGPAAGCAPLPPAPEAPLLELELSPVKQLDFRWASVEGAERYRLLESAAPGEPFVPIGHDVAGESISIAVPLHLRVAASYVLRACNDGGCADSEPVSVTGSLAEAVGYFKASNTGPGDRFGWSVALSGDGDTLAVGAFGEASAATDVDGDQTDDSAPGTGAVYVFVRDAMNQWSQQAYVKAPNAAFDGAALFGSSVALSEDGETLAVGAMYESGNTTGINGSPVDYFASRSGAVYVFVRDDVRHWPWQAYIKASNTDADDAFGQSIALSADGDTLAVGATGEASRATGIGGDEADDSAEHAGAVYVFVREAARWSQQAYVKGSNTEAGDYFGQSVALSRNGDTLAVGAGAEDSLATGIGGDESDDSTERAGAVYVFVRTEVDHWAQQAYVKASNPGYNDMFGVSVALDGDGSTLAVGAIYEADDSAPSAGAAYVFVRDADQWRQQAHIKASNADTNDLFGGAVALSDDGEALAVGAAGEGSLATGIDGDQADDSAPFAGAVYVFVHDGGRWSQRAYVKAPNSGAQDFFGVGWELIGPSRSLALSGDAGTLAVGAVGERSLATGIGGDQADDSAELAGAVYLY